MFLRYTIFYSVGGSIVGTLAQAMGAGLGVTISPHCLGPFRR